MSGNLEKVDDRDTETNSPVNVNVSSQDEPETSEGQSLEESYSVLKTKCSVLAENYVCVL